MKLTTQKKLRLFIVAALFLTSVLATLRAVCLFTHYEADVGYFRPSFAALLIRILYFLGVLACAAPLWVLPKNGISPKCDRLPRARLAVNLICTLIFFIGGVFFLANGAIYSQKLYIFVGIFSTIGALFFLFDVLITLPSLKDRCESTRPWFGACAVVALLLMLASAYFDMTVSINGPFTGSYLFTLLACAVFLLFELRHTLNRALPRAHFVLGLIAFFLSVSSGVGNLLFSLLGDLGSGKTVAEPARPLILLALACFIFLRLLTFDTSATTEEN